MNPPVDNDSASKVQQRQLLRYDAAYFAQYVSNERRSIMYQDEASRIQALISGGKILDVGCGVGAFLSHFSPSDWDRHGVDVSDVAIQASRRAGIKVNDFERAYNFSPELFDVIVFRGSLQLLPKPFETILKCIDLLRPGGWLVFLATPNSNSPYYRRFGTLPFLTPHANFLIPSDVMLRNILTNDGLDVQDVRYPYFRTPYCRLVIDGAMFLLSFLGVRRKFAFWRSSMEVYAVKPGPE